MNSTHTTTPRATGEVAHTPTPWSLMTHGKLTADIRAGETETNPGDLVATCNGHALREMNQANAAFIVRACNSHESLVSQVAKLREALDGFGIVRAGVLASLQSHASPLNMTNDIMEMLRGFEKTLDSARAALEQSSQ